MVGRVVDMKQLFDELQKWSDFERESKLVGTHI